MQKEKLKFYIKQSGLTITHIAAKLGVSRGTFYNLLERPWNCTYGQATMIQKLCDIPASEMGNIFLL